MNDVLTKEIDNIINTKKEIKETIIALQKLEKEKNKNLKNIEDTLNISITTCKNCHGKGGVLDRSDYGGCSTEYYTCNECQGKGYIITEK